MGKSLTTKKNKTSVLECQADGPSSLSSSGGHAAEVVGGSNTKLAGRGRGTVFYPEHPVNGLDADGGDGHSLQEAVAVWLADLARSKNGGGGVVASPSDAVDGGRPSLDRYRPSSNSGTKNGWDKKQKRGYHRVQSCLQYWQAHGYQVLWVMLSTASGGDASKLAYHHQRLRQRIEARLGYQGLQHYQVRTSEGNGVLHIFWAWRARDGCRQRSFYVKQAWLGIQWQDIHSAPIVWIVRVRRGRASINKVSRYCMSQYVSGQAGYEYMSWSWGRTFGFPLVACWRAFKGIWSKYNGNGRKKALYALWGVFLSGSAVPLWSGRYTSLEVVRLGYQEYRSDFWTSPQRG